MTDRAMERVGSTFHWTEEYPATHRRDGWRHLAFAVIVLVLAAGAAGMVAFEQEIRSAHAEAAAERNS